MKNKYDSVVVHYDEIGLKGSNRPRFERLLIKNIKTKTGLTGKREPGQITLTLKTGTNISKLEDQLARIPGIAFFSFAKKCKLNKEDIKNCVLKMLKNEKFETFKINTQRHDKNNPFKSMQMNAFLGEEVINKYNKKVRMKNPDLAVKVEISHKHAYVSIKDCAGVGGMPTDPKQKVVALLSGGFDSPVAAFLMMKRGCEVILVHFHNKNQMSRAVENKIVRLGKQLSKYQVKTKLYIIPFEDVQREIILKTQAKIRMLVYRRFMMRIASRIAKTSKAKFLVVGDSLSQVASQTFENLEATYKDAGKHVLSPLIGFDKKEIISIAKRIGTYELSSLPYGDCCSYFLPKHPELRASAKQLREIESRFNVETLVKKAVDKSKPQLL
jgi:thiamine biosynthesis protein ThiI